VTCLLLSLVLTLVLWLTGPPLLGSEPAALVLLAIGLSPFIGGGIYYRRRKLGNH
jgi:hypothetical protein